MALSCNRVLQCITAPVLGAIEPSPRSHHSNHWGRRTRWRATDAKCAGVTPWPRDPKPKSAFSHHCVTSVTAAGPDPSYIHAVVRIPWLTPWLTNWATRPSTASFFCAVPAFRLPHQFTGSEPYMPGRVFFLRTVPPFNNSLQKSSQMAQRRSIKGLLGKSRGACKDF
jgi:hypothetical protein